jgi:ABC-type nickel/cobalt efflux system permease component RcnA
MTRRGAAAAVAGLVAATLALTGTAAAHPLGNFSINHITQLKVSRDGVDAHYILDQAEIPTFQERGLSQAEILRRKRSEVASNLRLNVNGRPVPLRLGRASITFPAGQGGLKLTRFEIGLTAPVKAPRDVNLEDRTFEGRPGWKAIVVQPGEGTDIRSDAPSNDPTNGLRGYPSGALQSPLDERTADLRVRPGSGTLTAPRTPGGKPETTQNRSGDGLAGVFSDAANGQGVLLLLLLAAFAWGALHALSPGHGKAMVAAYLIGARGTARHAVALGATVTITHTIGVFALGLVTLALSQYVLPEDLYPWLNLVSGLLVVLVGAGVLRARLRAGRETGDGRPESSDHSHDHSHGHSHSHSHGHGHHHHHHAPGHITWKGLLGMGAAAGLVPCPSALVVLLGAIAQHQIGLGLVMIVAFSLGLATTLTVLGLLVVCARRAVRGLRVPPRLVAALPSASALVIVAVGVMLTAQALPQF